eukprot:11179640-Lingulodinium_polyedra.AAC.1
MRGFVMQHTSWIRDFLADLHLYHHTPAFRCEKTDLAHLFFLPAPVSLPGVSLAAPLAHRGFQ